MEVNGIKMHYMNAYKRYNETHYHVKHVLIKNFFKKN